MVKIVKNPGNGRLNNLNDPVLNALTCSLSELYDLTTPQIEITMNVQEPFLSVHNYESVRGHESSTTI